ncbi:hypothetical protein PIIN_06573 [Serendipita indica DSM 11827]|uniref:J domain-containing protein n=1 Tax=Serendipita indica (strain DSM 11827) TaxID=1109443 RepID=G4TMU3_SERID|nr:hypothetical protein PIIN_06573 [Serendipita indica DSM 11827]
MPRTSRVLTNLRNFGSRKPGPDFPTGPIDPQASPWEIFNLPAASTPEEIKRRYIELVKLHHPDSNPSEDAEERFHAITEAYNFLLTQSGSPRNGGMQAMFDAQAEEVRKRLATWKANEARRATSVFDKERTQRALDAEKGAWTWWNSDATLYYLLGGAALAVAVMHIQSRSAPVQKERLRRYIELRKEESRKDSE